jgi:DNA polymerase III subunit gamma/tau
LVEALIQEDPAAGLDQLHAALDGGSDPRQFARQIIDYLRSLLLVQMKNNDHIDAGLEIRAVMARQAEAFSTPRLLAVIKIFNQAANESRIAWQPSLPLELAFIEALEKPVQLEVSRLAVPPQSGSQPSEGRKAAPVRERAEKPVSQPDQPSQAQPDSGGQPQVLYQDSPGGEETSGTGLTMEMVAKNWRQVLVLVREQNPNTQGLLNSCKPLGVKEGVLYLGFNSDFSKAKMEKAENIQITERALQQVFGFEVPVVCRVASGKQGTTPPNIENDGMVATAVRDLGGEIVDIQ